MRPAFARLRRPWRSSNQLHQPGFAARRIKLTFMGLCMGRDREWVLRGVTGEPLNVALHDAIDHERRRG